jgi:hypothetical protein
LFVLFYYLARDSFPLRPFFLLPDKELEEEDRESADRNNRLSPERLTFLSNDLNDPGSSPPSIYTGGPPQAAPRPSLSNRTPSAPSAPLLAPITSLDGPTVPLLPQVIPLAGPSTAASNPGAPSFDRAAKPASISNAIAFSADPPRAAERKTTVPAIPDRYGRGDFVNSLF